MKKFKHLCLILAIILISACSVFSNALQVTATSSPAVKTTPYYLSENSNVDTIHATTVGALPCIGEAKIIVFYTDFKGGDTNWTKSPEEVENMFFSEVGKNDPSVAYTSEDSLRSYYYRSSYGKVDITGSVFEYQTQNHTSYYTSLDIVLDEIIEYYREIINWDAYDANNDGYIDGIYLIAKNWHSWGGPNFVAAYANTVGNKTICNACFLINCDFSTMCHETCHMFGPADMYAAVSLNPNGIQTACIMDNGYGDLPSATKFILGWLDNAIFVSSDNVGTHKLRSYTNYGDALIIYPNGDSKNRNWFFVEYVTNEGNNCGPGSQGLRVWKTQMNIDDNFDIVGAKDFCSGMPSSPYEFLEAIHPDGVWNYYMQVGERITPYTYPSTAYSDTFYNVGQAKLLKDLTFSGIHISFDRLEDDIASLDIRIESSVDSSKSTEATLIPLSTDNSSAFLDNKDLIPFAVLLSETELKITAPISLVSANSNESYTLETKLSKNNRELHLCITPTVLNSLKAHSDWTLSTPSLTTYYGTPVNLNNDTEAFDFSNYPTPLVDSSAPYATCFNMSFDYNLKCFKVSDSNIITIFYDDTVRKLYWGEVDLNSNTTEKYELVLPNDVITDAWTTNDLVSVWHDYNTYFVCIGNYICCYQDKVLTSCLNLTTIGDLHFIGIDNHSFFLNYNNGRIYQMSFANDLITLEMVDIYIPHTLTFQLQNAYSFFEDQYIITTKNTVRFVDIARHIDKNFFYEDGNSHSCTRIYFLNNHYYVFASGVDLKMYKYDRDFNLIEEICLLKDISSTIWGADQLNVDFCNDLWVIHFESVSNSNAISYANTYFIAFHEDGQIFTYYKYGDSSFRYVCQVIPLSSDEYLCIKPSAFMYIRAESEQHDYGDWTQVLSATCVNEGMERRDCADCDHYETRKIPAMGHNYTTAFTWYDFQTCTAIGTCSQCPATTEGHHVAVSCTVYLDGLSVGKLSYVSYMASAELAGKTYTDQLKIAGSIADNLISIDLSEKLNRDDILVIVASYTSSGCMIDTSVIADPDQVIAETLCGDRAYVFILRSSDYTPLFNHLVLHLN